MSLTVSRLQRRLILSIGLLAVFGVVVWLGTSTNGEPARFPDTKRDVELFRAVVHQMEDGQPYYQAMGGELRARQYPAGSVFNWRQPFLYSLLAFLRPTASLILLIALSLALFVEAGRTLKPNVIGVAMVGNVTLTMGLDGMLGPPVITYFTELWAGVCIGLSVLAYARNRTINGAVWGLLALFIRELAAPYAALAAFLAVRGRRWQEVRVWVFGAACYGMYYTLHSWQALRHMHPGDFSHADSWLYWGGLTFLLKTWRYNGFLLIVPTWMFALVVVAMVVVYWAHEMPTHLRFSVLLYCVLFLAVGQPFNDYWGFLTAPSIALWLAYAPEGARALFASAGFDRLSYTDAAVIRQISPRRIPSLQQLVRKERG